MCFQLFMGSAKVLRSLRDLPFSSYVFSKMHKKSPNSALNVEKTCRSKVSVVIFWWPTGAYSNAVMGNVASLSCRWTASFCVLLYDASVYAFTLQKILYVHFGMLEEDIIYVPGICQKKRKTCFWWRRILREISVMANRKLFPVSKLRFMIFKNVDLG